MKILLADDEKSIAVTLGDALRGEGYGVTVVDDGKKALKALQKDRFDCVITDVRMPGADGMEIFREARRIHPGIRVVIITAFADIKSSVAAVKEGAEDYIQKPFYNEDVLVRLRKLERVMDLEKENRRLRDELHESRSLGSMVGQSPRMREVFDLILSVGQSDATILVEGENGTGKELVAEAIHHNSPRREGPFVKMSCSVFPENLIESELFGHVKGAFTDARADRTGRFERAHGGTIFIDDVDDLVPAAQVKLLRVLQEREFERVGGAKTIQVDLRVVAATKQDLWALSKEGRFREDLFHRLNVVRIPLPPLRERMEDIPFLVEHFLRKHGPGQDYSVAPDTLEALQSYGWPGNVRELEHAVERGIALSGAETLLQRDHLLRPLPLPGTQQPQAGLLGKLKAVATEAEARHIRNVLAHTGGHRSESARILGVTRKTLWEKMREYGIS